VSGVLAVILSAWLSSWAQRRISASGAPDLRCVYGLPRCE